MKFTITALFLVPAILAVVNADCWGDLATCSQEVALKDVHLRRCKAEKLQAETDRDACTAAQQKSSREAHCWECVYQTEFLRCVDATGGRNSAGAWKACHPYHDRWYQQCMNGAVCGTASFSALSGRFGFNQEFM
ncbi:hypothetical protein BGX24_012642 [Mortierella sp. AD032]|nr:hypothetical protein BGX24_012642 [Mortierella sp. AD032]